MSDRDRSEFVALVAVVCTVVVFLIGLWAGDHYSERQNHNDTQSNRPNLQFLEGSPESYQAICNGPQDETHADLCQQWRAAEAATNAAGWTQVQTWIGIFGLAGLVATVIYAVRAFHQTAIQANAAQEANKLTRDNIDAQQRPWMKLNIQSIDEIRSDLKNINADIEVQIENISDFPAVSVHLSCQVYWSVSGHLAGGSQAEALVAETIRIFGDHLRGFIVLPGDELTQGFRNLRGIQLNDRTETDGDVSLSVVICVIYRSAAASASKWRHAAHVFHIGSTGRNTFKFSDATHLSETLQVMQLPGNSLVS